MSALVSMVVPAKRSPESLRALDAFLDGRGEFTGPAIRELLVGDPGYVEMDVDAVQQRPADPLLDWVIAPETQLQTWRGSA